MTTQAQEPKTTCNPEWENPVEPDNPEYLWSITVLGDAVIKAYIRPGIYRHYKGGLYQVLGITHMDGTRKPYVRYRPLYVIEDYPFGQETIRDFDEFIGWIEVTAANIHEVDGQAYRDMEKVKRFVWISVAPWIG